MNSKNALSISELTLTELLALTNEDVLNRVRSGEWNLEQFTQWSEDRLNHAYGDGYDEGYSTAEYVTLTHTTN